MFSIWAGKKRNRLVENKVRKLIPPVPDENGWILESLKYTNLQYETTREKYPYYSISMLHLTSTIYMANIFAPFQKKVLTDFFFEMSSRTNEEGRLLLSGYPLHLYPEDMTKELIPLLEKTPIMNFGLFGSIPEKIEKLTKRLESFADTLFVKREEEYKNGSFRGHTLKQTIEYFLRLYPEYKKPDPEIKLLGLTSNKASERLLKLMLQIIRIAEAIVPPSKDDIFKDLVKGKKEEDKPFKELEKLAINNRYHLRSPPKQVWEDFKKFGLLGSLDLRYDNFNALKNAKFNILNFVPIYERISNNKIELNDYSLLWGFYSSTSTFMSQQQTNGQTINGLPFFEIRQLASFQGTLSAFCKNATPDKIRQLFSTSFKNPYRIMLSEDGVPFIGKIMGYYCGRLFSGCYAFDKNRNILSPIIWANVRPLSQAYFCFQNVFRTKDSFRRAMESLGLDPNAEISSKREPVIEVRDNAEVFWINQFARQKDLKLKNKYAEVYLPKLVSKTNAERRKSLNEFFQSEEWKKQRDIYKIENPKFYEGYKEAKSYKGKLVYLAKNEKDQTLKSKYLCELLYQDTGITFINSGLTFVGQRQNIWVQPFLNSLSLLALEGFKKISIYKDVPASLPKDVRRVWTALVEILPDEEKKNLDKSILENFVIKKWEYTYSSILSIIPVIHLEKNYSKSKRWGSWDSLIPLPSLYKIEDTETIKISKGKLTSKLDENIIFEKLLRQFISFYGSEEKNIEQNARESWENNLKTFFKTSLRLLSKHTYSNFLDWVLQNEVHSDLFKKIRKGLKKEIKSFFKKLNWDWTFLNGNYCKTIREDEEDMDSSALDRLFFNFQFKNQKEFGKSNIIPIFTF